MKDLNLSLVMQEDEDEDETTTGSREEDLDTGVGGGVGEGVGRRYERVGLSAPAILAEPKGSSASAMLCMHSFSIADQHTHQVERRSLGTPIFFLVFTVLIIFVYEG